MPRSFLVKKHFNASKKPNYSELDTHTGTNSLCKSVREQTAVPLELGAHTGLLSFQCCAKTVLGVS